MKKIIFKIFTFVIVIAIGSAVGAYIWYNNGITKINSDSSDPIVFIVEANQSIDTIGDNLLQNGLISSKLIFSIYGKLNPSEVTAIQAGYFNIPGNLTIPQVYTILKQAQNKEDIRVTIVEGLRYDEVVEVVAKAFTESTKFSKAEMTNIIEHPDDQIFSTKIQNYLNDYKPKGKNLEGFLFPDTYFFSKDSSAKDVVERLVGTLFSRISNDDLAKAKSSNYSLYDYLIVASYLEKEANTKSDEEMSMISDIIYKRLEHGVEGSGSRLLQLDVTLSYLVRDWNYFKTHSFNVEKAKDNDYNTYIRPGLTSTPINNPGIGTIHAAINPIANDYYYYIYDLKGDVYYAKTLSQHERNVAQYL